MRSLDDYFLEYAADHRTGGNEVAHALGIPAILFSTIRLLSLPTLARVGPVPIDPALIAIIVVTAVYAALSARLAAGMLVALAAMWGAGRALAVPLWAALAIGAVGWVLQIAGHAAFEHNRPTFLRNLVHMLVGPIWLLNLLLRVAPTGLERSGPRP